MSNETRRGLLTSAAATLATLPLAGCDKVADRLLQLGENTTRTVHRAILPRAALAQEFAAGLISAEFRANGSTDPQTPEYLTDSTTGFETWRLTIDGLVERALSLDLAALRAAPARTQTTRHDCVEGWSAIATWSGARLGPLLHAASLKPSARYLVFHCADDLGQSADGQERYYTSIDLNDAFHPQTILAYDMNGEPLTIAHGAPARLRVERQLGYKHAKYVMRIEAVASFDHIGGGKGGYWEDRGYDWYAGV